MPVSIARKLQAFRDAFFPGLRFEVVPAALTREQVRELRLPSTPLKPGDPRAAPWRRAFGHQQTEIDALATLRPDLLRRIVETALEPYYDRTLAGRIQQAAADWRDQAQEVIDAHVDADELDERIRRWLRTTGSGIRQPSGAITRGLKGAPMGRTTTDTLPLSDRLGQLAQAVSIDNMYSWSCENT